LRASEPNGEGRTTAWTERGEGRRSCKRARKKTALIRADRGTIRDIIEHKEMRIKEDTKEEEV
jgi:hypothetical protein